MRTNLKKSFYLVFAFIFLTFSLLSCGKLFSKTPEKQSESTGSAGQEDLQLVVDTDDNYVAKVADEKITQSEFYYFYDESKTELESNSDKQNPMDENELKKVALESTLSKLKEYKIQLIQAKKNNTVLTEQEKAELQKTLDEMTGGADGEEGFATQLSESSGISIEQFKSIHENLTIIEKFMSNRDKVIPITDEEAKKYYNDNKDKFNLVTVNHVLFLTIDKATNQPLPADKIKKAEQDANECLAKVNAGANITELAKTLSQDPDVKYNKGEYVVHKGGKKPPEFENWALSKKVGDTGIVKTSDGYHVMKIIKITSPEDGIERTKSELQSMKLIDLTEQSE